MKEEMLNIKVASKSEVKSVAGSIANYVKDEIVGTDKHIEIDVIGAGALNQAIKSIIIARGMLFPVNLDLVVIPRFQNLDIEGKELTSINLKLEVKEI